MTGFFLVSGYTLFYVYAEKDMQDIHEITKFYLKRLISILPAYYVIAILFIIFRNTENWRHIIVLAPIEILGIQSLFSSLFPISHNSGTWFISCILICYVLFPFMSSLSKQMKFKHKCILAFILVGVLSYSPIIVHVFSLSTIYSNPFFRGCEFFIGVLLCSSRNELKEHYLFKKIFLNGYAITVEGILLISGVTIMYNWGIDGDYMVYSCVVLPIFILQLAALAEMPFNRVFNSKCIAYASSLCYAFFLGQLFSPAIVNILVDKGFLTSNLLRIMVLFILTGGYAVVIHELVEKPSKKIIMKCLRIE